MYCGQMSSEQSGCGVVPRFSGQKPRRETVNELAEDPCGRQDDISRVELPRR